MGLPAWFLLGEIVVFWKLPMQGSACGAPLAMTLSAHNVEFKPTLLLFPGTEALAESTEPLVDACSAPLLFAIFFKVVEGDGVPSLVFGAATTGAALWARGCLALTAAKHRRQTRWLMEDIVCVSCEDAL